MTQPVIFFTNYSSQLQDSELSSARLLENYVRDLSANERFTEDWLIQARNYLLQAIRDLDINERNIIQQNYTVWNREYTNIIVRFDSENSEAKKYVIWAHYDWHDELPWADDNASWVAWILEIARLIQENRFVFADKTIELVFYSTEELPYFWTTDMWSYKHASTNPDIELAIILEMIGYFSDEAWSQSYPFWFMKYLYWDQWNFIALASNFENMSSVRDVKKYFQAFLQKQNEVVVQSINAPNIVQWISFSDHRNYWKFDTPAFMVTDTAFYRNKNYHTAQDTYEKLDYNKMKSVVDATLITLENL